MKFSACIEDKYMFGEQPDIPARIRAAAAAGLGLVDFHLWQDRDIDAIERALTESGVSLKSIVVNPRCGVADRSKHDFFLNAMRGSFAMATRLNAEAVVVAGGFAVAGATDAEQHAAMVEGLKRVAPLAEEARKQVLLEPLNTRVDHPAMFMATAAEGFEIVEEVGSPNVRLLYDIYHSAVMGESPEKVVAGREHLIGYVQVADMPGRHEPGSGTIDWRACMKVLKSAGYRGPIGLEYRPSGTTIYSLARTRLVLGA